eukprot:6311614-Pyramimonas_sp.AAC.1
MFCAPRGFLGSTLGPPLAAPPPLAPRAREGGPAQIQEVRAERPLFMLVACFLFLLRAPSG